MEFIKLLMILIAADTVAAGQGKPRCQRQCGNLSIPYPFGTEEGCYLDDKFLITCNRTDCTPKAFLRRGNLQVLDINITGGWVRILPRCIARDCYNSSGREFRNSPRLESGLYYISHTQNKFTAIGCDSYALIDGYQAQGYTTGCLSIWNNISDVIDGSCSGIGCCEAAIPRGVKDYTITLSSYNNHTDVLRFNPCSYAFVAENEKYNFSELHLGEANMTRLSPMILDWAVGDQSCAEAEKEPGYACKGNSSCHDPENGQGYLCHCGPGFQGNIG